MDGKCSEMRPVIERPVTTHARSGGTSGATRARVSCIILFPLGRGKNCFGKLGVLRGHRRVPLPPAKMTALRWFILLRSSNRDRGEYSMPAIGRQGGGVFGSGLECAFC